MSFNKGDMVITTGESIDGGFQHMMGKIVGIEQVDGYLADLYVVEFFDAVRTFTSDNLMAVSDDEIIDDEEDNVLSMNIGPDISLSHIVSIQGNNFMLTSAEVRHLRNLLAVFE